MGGPAAELSGWDLSCLDWEERLRTGRGLVPSLPLFRAEADRAAAIFDRLRIPDIPGTPTFAEAAGDWFRDIVRAMFGSYDATTQRRFIRELFLLVPKKNSKTTNGSGLMLTALLVNKRPRAEFLMVAPTQKISLLAFEQLCGMIEIDARLKAAFHLQGHLKKVTFRPTNATLEIKSFSPSVMTGVKPSGVMVDELHVIAEASDADRVMGQIRGGIVSQPEAFFAITTTQSERPPRGVFKAELAKARAIRDGKATGKMLPVLYEFPDAIGRAKREPDKPYPWEAKAFWHMVTPNDGRSITVDRLVEDYETAKLAGEEELRRWATQHLNVEIGMAQGDGRWAGAEHWEKQADETLTFDEILARSDVVTVGIDGGGLDDLLGFAVIGRDRDSREWLLWIRAWMHRGVLERRKSEASNFRDFERDGDLVIVDDMGTAYAELVELVAVVNDAGLLAAVGLDPVGVGLIVDELSRRGITQEGDQVVGVSQGYKLTGTIKTLEVKLSDASCVHPGQPLMTWCVGNARVEPRGNAVLITKQVSGTGKIDPLMAAFDAASLMATNPEPKGSAYSADRGLTFF